MFPVRKILCTTDFSPASRAGVEAARELAAQTGAQVILLHVVAPVPVLGAPSHTPPVTFDVPAYQREFVDGAEENIDKLAGESFGDAASVTTLVVVGYPSDEIVRTAESEGVDVIVISTHGHRGWQRFLLGSVTEKVVRNAHCPVLSIRSTEEGS